VQLSYYAVKFADGTTANRTLQHVRLPSAASTTAAATATASVSPKPQATTAAAVKPQLGIVTAAIAAAVSTAATTTASTIATTTAAAVAAYSVSSRVEVLWGPGVIYTAFVKAVTATAGKHHYDVKYYGGLVQLGVQSRLVRYSAPDSHVPTDTAPVLRAGTVVDVLSSSTGQWRNGVIRGVSGSSKDTVYTVLVSNEQLRAAQRQLRLPAKQLSSAVRLQDVTLQMGNLMGSQYSAAG
jgi:hypothetical protein